MDGHRRIFRRLVYFKEETMFEVTPKAGEMIKDYLKDHEELPSIRILLNSGG